MASGLRGFARLSRVLAALVLAGTMVAVWPTPAGAEDPAIVSFAPTSGHVGTAVTVTGSDFVGVSAVTFNGVEAAFMVPSSSSIATSVPPLAYSGPITVTASGSTVATEADFTVLGDLTLSAPSGPPTSMVAVAGSGFGARETVRLLFAGASVGHAVTDAHGAFAEATFRVPGPATPGPHRLSARGVDSGVRATTSFVVRTDWPQFRGSPSHQGVNRYENVLSAANVSRLERVWTFATGGEVRGSPTVVGGVLYIGSQDGELYALDASTGSLRWSETIGGNDTPAVIRGTAYGVSGEAYALDAAGGESLWTSSDGGYSGSPTFADGIVYVCAYDGVVAALDASTGTPVWSRTFPNVIGESTPAVVDGALYVGSHGEPAHVYALDAATGETRWTFRVPSYMQSSPAVLGGTVYIGAADGRLYALDASTGDLVWTSDARGFDSSPAVANGIVFVGTGFGDVDAYRARTGALLWRFHAAGGRDVDSSPTVANGVVYVGSDSGWVYALAASTGRELWSYRTGRSGFSSPTVVDGMVFVGDRNGRIFAFGLR